MFIAKIILINLYVIVLYAGGPSVLIPGTSTIPIPQQCYKISFVLFIHSFGGWREFIKEPSKACSS